MKIPPTTLTQNQNYTKLLSQIDMKRIEDYAKQAVLDDTSFSSSELSWWDKFWYNEQFITKLHVSLYGLLLGITDDILANTRINILNDTLRLDIVAPTTTTTTAMNENDGFWKTTTSSGDVCTRDRPDRSGGGGGGNVGIFAAASFAVGMGLGMAAMAVITTTTTTGGSQSSSR